MSDKPIIGVIGVGFVGRAVARGFNLFADIRTYDLDPNRCTHTFEEVLQSNFVFVCLPTPMLRAAGDDCDLHIIEDFFKGADDYLDGRERPIFVVKSTVPVGTTSRLNEAHPNLPIVHSPEFLTARSALVDFITPARNIVGGELTPAVKVKEMFEKRFPGVPCLVMSSDESEFVKYAANCFFATKVLFFNEMRLLADKVGIDWSNVIDGVMADGRIGTSHYQVPGHDGDWGVGGTCFPKDINAMIRTMEKHGIDPLVLRAVWEQNKNVRQNRDWETNPSAVTQPKEPS